MEKSRQSTIQSRADVRRKWTPITGGRGFLITSIQWSHDWSPLQIRFRVIVNLFDKSSALHSPSRSARQASGDTENHQSTGKTAEEILGDLLTYMDKNLGQNSVLVHFNIVHDVDEVFVPNSAAKGPETPWMSRNLACKDVSHPVVKEFNGLWPLQQETRRKNKKLWSEELFNQKSAQQDFTIVSHFSNTHSLFRRLLKELVRHCQKLLFENQVWCLKRIKTSFK